MGQNWEVWTPPSEEGWVSHAPNQNAAILLGVAVIPDLRPDSHSVELVLG